MFGQTQRHKWMTFNLTHKHHICKFFLQIINIISRKFVSTTTKWEAKSLTSYGDNEDPESLTIESDVLTNSNHQSASSQNQERWLIHILGPNNALKIFIKHLKKWSPITQLHYYTHPLTRDWLWKQPLNKNPSRSQLSLDRGAKP